MMNKTEKSNRAGGGVEKRLEVFPQTMLAELLDRESFCGKRKMRKANRLFTSYLLSKMGARGNSSNSALWGRWKVASQYFRSKLNLERRRTQRSLCKDPFQSAKATSMLNIHWDGKRIYFPSVNSFFSSLFCSTVVVFSGRINFPSLLYWQGRGTWDEVGRRKRIRNPH